MTTHDENERIGQSFLRSRPEDIPGAILKARRLVANMAISNESSECLFRQESLQPIFKTILYNILIFLIFLLLLLLLVLFVFTKPFLKA